MSFQNFCGVDDSAEDAVRRCFRRGDFTRLQQLKSTYDPRNLFRSNFNIAPSAA